jgi:hypothetical protein
MSLISDALRKAQVETAQRDRMQHRLYLTHGGRTIAQRPGLSRYAIVLAALLGGCITAGALLFHSAASKAQPQPAARVVAVVPPAPAPAAVAQAAPAVLHPSEPKRAAPTRPRRKPAAEAVTPPPQARASRDSFVSGETYASPVQGPLGTSLTLSGISSARGDSVAIINGSLVRAGGVVGPFVIEQIEQRRVRVRYVDVSFWVTY